ncbi:MAG TPA: hypothetical protein DCF93_01130 [Desulfuromonas sp.]|nr:hypothetical protein [Desulfuromonas sp.]
MRFKETMARIFSILLWSAVFCLALLLIDLVFVHVPMRVSGLTEAQRFYVDFRGRLLALTKPRVEPTIEGLIEKSVTLKDAAVDSVKESLAPEVKGSTVTPAAKPVAAPREKTPARPVVSAPSTPAPKVAAAAPAPARHAPVAAAKPVASAKSATSGYVYADDSGEIHIVERLEQVPRRYRQRAQPLAE